MLLSRLSSTFLSLPARSSSLPARLPGSSLPGSSLPGSSLPGSRNDSGRAEPLESVRDDSPPLGSREASGRSEPLETVRDDSPPLKAPSDEASS